MENLLNPHELKMNLISEWLHKFGLRPHCIAEMIYWNCYKILST